MALPYCDNLTIFGRDRLKVNVALDGLVSMFRSKGFKLHELEEARTIAEPLGTLYDGESHVVRPKPERLWRLRGDPSSASGMGQDDRTAEGA